jgi:phage-related protein
MATSRTLKLSLLADVAGLSKGLTKGSNEVQGFGGKVADFGKKAAVAFAAAAVAATAFAVKFGKDAIVAGEAAATANARIEQINKSMGLFGQSTTQVSESLIKYAEQTARLTGVDTNSIKLTQAKLLTFKELAATADQLGGNFERTTKAAIDLGAAGFGTAENNAVALGKALNDPIKGITALTRNGITFTESEKDRIKVLVESNKVGEAQNLILQAIETQVGGTAEATANATDRMKVGFTQVQERIGLALLPVLDKFTAFMLDKLFPAFEKYVAPAVQRLVDLFSNDAGGLGNSFNKIIEVVKSFVLPIFTGITKVFEKVSVAIKDNIGSFKSFFDVVKSLAPLIGKIIGGALSVVGDIAVVVIKIISTVISAIKPLINSFIDGINLVIKGLNLIPGVNITPIGKIGDSGSKANSGLSAGLYGSTPALVPTSQITNMQAAAAAATSGISTGMGSGGSSSAKAPKVSAPKFVTPVNLPAFNPQAYDSSLTRTEGNIYNVTVNGALDAESTARQIVTILNDSQARGTLGASGLIGAVSF